MSIEDWLDRPAVSHRFETTLPLPPHQSLQLALDTPVAPDRLVRRLFKARGLDADGTIGEFGSERPFMVLEQGPSEWVAGVGAAVWRPGGAGGPTLRDPADWHDFDAPGTVRAVMSFRAVPRGSDKGSSRLITETLAKPSDRSAARAFGLYWLFVGPFSKLIRKRWLRAIAELAEVQSARNR